MQNHTRLKSPSIADTGLNGRMAIHRLLTLIAGLALCSISFADQWPIRRSLELYEMRLLRGFIEHHQIVSEMSSLGPKRAVHPELGELTLYKTWALRSRIDDFQELLANWYDRSHEPDATRRDERLIERLAALEGENYEFAFLTELIRQNSVLLRMGRRAERQRMGHPELQAMWADWRAELEAENAQASEWLCLWYGKCRGTGIGFEEAARRGRRR